MVQSRPTAEALRQRGLTLPGAHEDHPWGETVLKVKGKVFLFFGRAEEGVLRIAVKLPHTGERWLDQPFAEPTGYGLGKSGWVTFTFEAGDLLPNEELFALLLESYRAVAPKTLLRELDGAGSRGPATPERSTRPRGSGTTGRGGRRKA
jgi:predicted DNA-binding protein (MmcQ/YjbR family)